MFYCTDEDASSGSTNQLPLRERNSDNWLPKNDFAEGLGKNAATSSGSDSRSTTYGELVSLAREEMNDKDCSPTNDVRKEFEQLVHALWCSLQTY